MAHIDVNSLQYHLPDGRILLQDVSFRIGDGDKAALVGVNGAGKTTLLRLIAGDVEPHGGAVVRSGGLGVMRQFVDRKVERDEPGPGGPRSPGGPRAPGGPPAATTATPAPETAPPGPPTLRPLPPPLPPPGV